MRLYLALRLASLKHQLRHGQPVPVVIDDCLIQLDDDRAVRGDEDPVRAIGVNAGDSCLPITDISWNWQRSASGFRRVFHVHHL